ncbi:MAG TPA: RIP metalloprotease RseP [Vicinamibacterales bacterium]|nr:RIP metalloprotease RseP [Vicinamibacterales bacterium]
MTTLLAFAFVLGVLIFVHELGHFMMARRVGVRVLKFSLGFGPRLVGFKRGDTEYVISAIPLGGYVKMAGENPDDKPSGRDDEFLSKTKWQRFQVLIMGPVMNLLLAVLVTAGVLMTGVDISALSAKPPIVGQVTPGSAGLSAGIQTGDRIVSVAGRDVATWEQFFIAIGTRASRETDIVVFRDGKELALKVTPTPQTRFEVGDIGVLPDSHPHVRATIAGAPADKGGLKAGDVIMEVDGAGIALPSQLISAISKKAGTPVTVTVMRGGIEQDLSIVPEANTGRCPSLPQGAGCIGISIGEDVTRINPGPIDALVMSVTRNYEHASLIFQTIGQLITRETSTRQLMGPLAIAQLSGESAQQGLVSLFALMAMISLNLGILNLLPIPVLDGGHIFIMALEGLARRDFSMRVKEKMLLAGFAMLLMLMVTVIYNDLTRIPTVERLMPWR